MRITQKIRDKNLRCLTKFAGKTKIKNMILINASQK